MDSKLGLLIQVNGVLLITVLSLLLRRSLKLNASKYWAAAWLAMSLALISLRLAFSFEQLSALLLTFYYFGEYAFGFFMIAGIRSLDDDAAKLPRQKLYFVPFVALALALPQIADDFNNVLNVHSLVMAGFFAVAFYELGHSRVRSLGRRVMRAALICLAASFSLYFVAFSFRYSVDLFTSFLPYNSMIDLVLETTLGFGMVIVLLEKVLSESRTVGEQLLIANERLEQMVHTDPLTDAFNRHAFYGFLEKNGEAKSTVSGCVGFFDIDDLKRINDEHGHAAGDSVIRTVVRAIREVIRAEDLIYRWGGDEFFVIMVGMSADFAMERMTQIEEMLRSVQIPGIADPISLSVSYGFTDFLDTRSLEAAMSAADAQMYRRKHERKTRRFVPTFGIDYQLIGNAR